MTTFRPKPSELLSGCVTVIVGLLVLQFAQPCAAQPPVGNTFGSQSIRRPTTSPYLNLHRTGDPGIDFAIDYQKLVRPEQQLRNYSANLNSRLNRLEHRVNQAIAPDGSLILPGTGHATTFMNTGRYFPGYRGR
jgi:hypothetical protein